MSRRKPPRSPTYPGGMDAVIAQMEARRDPLTYGPAEALPPLDCDLAAMRGQTVLRPADDPEVQSPTTTFGRKRKALRKEFRGEPELCYLNGILIANLRRRAQPDHCATLFVRLWAEEADFLIRHLDPRWLVSAVTTFGDHGQTEVQRRVGLTLSVLFNTMKLYESERVYSGRAADEPFALRGRSKTPLPLQMDRFAIENGGLDVNMLGRLWQDAAEDTVIRPLAHHLLDELIHDPRTVFRRLRRMRARKERKKARADSADLPTPALAPANGPPKWGIVATVKAPLDEVAGFVAHHLELGADRVHLFLDAPDSEAEAWFAGHDRVNVTQCDDAYWAAAPRGRMAAHQLRQAHNATMTYRASDLHWLAHVDVDEFLLPERDIAAQLADLPEEAPYGRVIPVELLVPDGGSDWRHFKRLPASAGHTKAVMEDICPNFGAHIRKGFLSHTGGKVFARTGIAGARLGIHSLKHRGARLGKGAVLTDTALAHCHATSWAHFRDRMTFRLEQGSYRGKDSEKLGLDDILRFVMDEQGEAGLRALFDEMCVASPGLLARLRAHDMLLTRPLDPAAARARVFGANAGLRAAGE